MKRWTGIAALLACLSVIETAYAADNQLLVVGGVDFASNSGGLSSNGGDLSTLVSTISPSVTLAHGNFYSSLTVEQTLGSKTAVLMDNGYPQIVSAERQGYDLTLGYRLSDSVSIFTGWQKNDINGLVTGMHEENSTDGYQPAVMHVDYATNGPYVGAAWSHGFGKKGTLGLTAGYAVLSYADNETRSTASPTVSPPAIITNFNASGSTRGFSYGVSWTGDLTGSLAYRVGVKGIRYTSGPSSINPNGVVDQFTSYYVGISNYF
jgi:hypothetical protein